MEAVSLESVILNILRDYPESIIQIRMLNQKFGETEYGVFLDEETKPALVFSIFDEAPSNAIN